MRPSSSASIACIASPAWSGFNRFYQHSHWKILIAGKTFRTNEEDPAQEPGLLANDCNLAMAMMAVMTTMMDSGIGRNHRTSKNDQCNGSK
jgi:predicted NAD-dependent protein-ADP-ribosyltransferase YbiA (DUF1768 family)